MKSPNSIRCLACSIFKDFLDAILSEGEMNLDVEYISSMLHMHPSRLDEILEEKLAENQNISRNTLILFGDCHPYMQDQMKRYHAHRVAGINCAEILLGRKTYQALRKEGVFFLMPEWTIHWKEVFQQELGLDNTLAKEMMQDMHSRLVYLDLGTRRIPRMILNEISEYTGLPVKIMKVDPSLFKTHLESALKSLQGDLSVQSTEQQNLAFQSMALDMIEAMLHQADNPNQLQSDIASQMRAFTGARVVILAQFVDEFDKPGHKIMVVDPERHRDIEKADSVHAMLWETRHLMQSKLWEPNAVNPDIGRFMKDANFEMSIAVPLHVGKKRVGALLLLGLPDDNSIGMALKMLDIIATILALIFRNALLLSHQENIIEKQTRKLRESESKYRLLFNVAGDSIVIHSLHGNFIEVNDIACEALGYSHDELLRLHLKDIDASPSDYAMNLHLKTIQKKGALVFESELRTKEGQLLPVEINSRLIDYEGGSAILSVVRDISERKQQDKKLESLLKEKEVLLKEVYHRVKNNFMIISSLLHLQSSKIKNQKALSLFQESRDRVQTMALIHQQLYRSADLASINFKSFIEQLTGNLYRSYVSNPSKIKLLQHVDDVSISVNKAIPCGLILNELITNALKYAFPGNREGLLKVELLSPDENQIKLHVCDNGVGLPKEIDVAKSESLGLRMVSMLSQQIRGKLRVKSSKGLCVTITFPRGEEQTVEEVKE
ncbi:DUF1638 domain-containing protein [bacterium]|nr:DUF1638 domain-containing protein [bacterium]